MRRFTKEAFILFCLGMFIVVCVLLDDIVHADDYGSAMVGVFSSGKSNLAECKLVNFGHRERLPLGLSYQYEGGGWTDVAGNGRKGSLYGAAQLGVQADSTLTARFMAGPALISSPDAYLGGVFQFTEDFFLGIHGDNGNIVGVKYKHISSAGIEQPNVGRDFAGIEVSIPF